MAFRGDRLGTAKPVGYERLADGAERERMRAHWRAALDRLAALYADG